MEIAAVAGFPQPLYEVQESYNLQLIPVAIECDCGLDPDAPVGGFYLLLCPAPGE